MTLMNLCSLADAYYIAKRKTELDQKHIASSDLIFSDGTTKHHVNNDGYISIYNVEDANYLLYLDQDGNIFLWVYELILEVKYKEIIDRINKIRDTMGMYKHTVKAREKSNIVKQTIPSSVQKDEVLNNNEEEIIKEDNKQEEDIINNKKHKTIHYNREEDKYIGSAPAEIVDLNNLECTECQSKSFSSIIANEDYSLECTCDNCGTKFVFIPSKYYIIKSKTIVTNTENNAISEYLIDNRRYNFRNAESED